MSQVYQGMNPTAPSTGADILAGSSILQPVHIRRVENGFIADIGCKTFVSTSWMTMAKGLDEYYKDPVKAAKKYLNQKGVK